MVIGKNKNIEDSDIIFHNQGGQLMQSVMPTRIIKIFKYIHPNYIYIKLKPNWPTRQVIIYKLALQGTKNLLWDIRGRLEIDYLLENLY